ncbi:MAG: hypothetical protein JSS32_04770 [Verrucomicrobia bacterium]|nr:hypothetical protein [Verrucomicrobiota bacterium]
MIAIAFSLCLTIHILQGVLFPAFPLLAFAPFFAFCCLKTTLKSTLWLAASAGLWVDLFSDDPFGLHSVNYTVISALFYPLKRRFSHEEPIHLGLYTSFISAASTLLQLFLLFLFDRRVPISGKWALVDCLGMPIVDGIYALVFLSGPLRLFQWLRYQWVVYWLRRKKKNPSRTSR